MGVGGGGDGGGGDSGGWGGGHVGADFRPPFSQRLQPETKRPQL